MNIATISSPRRRRLGRTATVAAAVAAFGLAASGTRAVASVTTFATFTAGTSAFTGGPYSVADKFTVGSTNVQITSLGLYDDGNDGFAANHTVSIYAYDPAATSFGASTPLATITTGTGTTGTALVTGGTATASFRYFTPAVQPILQAGKTYLLYANAVGGGPDGFVNAESFGSTSFSPAFSGQVGYNGPADGYANGVGGTAAYFGPNFQYSLSVPEPATAGTLLAAATATLAARRRRSAAGR